MCLPLCPESLVLTMWLSWCFLPTGRLKQQQGQFKKLQNTRWLQVLMHMAVLHPRNGLYKDDTLTPLQGHSDIRVIDLDETEGPPKQQHTEHSQDIDTFFSLAFMKEGKNKAECKQVSFINEVSTLHCHMQAIHKAKRYGPPKGTDRVPTSGVVQEKAERGQQVSD
ncbi:hypothetical protein F5141DRAFT_1061875 [Pisolithus sp. B1]|nr:hypothetical protein F5141DRAFT_1061875 [Pisolithus sp. B1]